MMYLTSSSDCSRVKRHRLHLEFGRATFVWDCYNSSRVSKTEVVQCYNIIFVMTDFT